MRNFTYQNGTEIIFGKAMQERVGLETLKYGKKVLLHYGGGSIKKTGLYDEIKCSLLEQGIEIFELAGVQPNPRVSLVREGIRICKEHHITFILAVGGGSVIDSAKAIAIGAKHNQDVWDFFLGKATIVEVLPIGVVLTIPAAGSESSTGTVITNEDGWYKRSTGSILLRPKFAIMNPELTFTLPNYQTASGAADMIAHVCERYFTNESAVEFTDQLCEATIRTIIKQAQLCLKEPTNYAARAELMWAGTIAHNGLLGTGREEDWASHAIEHEISGIYDITHGAGLAIIMPAWMKYVYKHNIVRFAQFAHRIFHIEIDFENLEQTALAGIDSLIQFFKDIQLPTTLSEAHIPTDRIHEMAKKATEYRSIGRFMKLSEQDVINIFHIAAK